MLQGDEVNGFALVVHFDQGLENGPVAEIIKHLGARFEFLHTFAHAIVGREENATEDALLGLGRVRRKTVNSRRGVGKAGLAATGFLEVRGGAGAFGHGVNHGTSMDLSVAENQTEFIKRCAQVVRSGKHFARGHQ